MKILQLKKKLAERRPVFRSHKIPASLKIKTRHIVTCSICSISYKNFSYFLSLYFICYLSKLQTNLRKKLEKARRWIFCLNLSTLVFWLILSWAELSPSLVAGIYYCFFIMLKSIIHLLCCQLSHKFRRITFYCFKQWMKNDAVINTLFPYYSIYI